MAKYIRTFTVLPKDLFRLNNGPSISLRDKALKRSGSYDISTEAGKVKPKALDPISYESPNGASMRPNTTRQQTLVHDFKGRDVIVYAVPAGTQLPSDLILVHEFGDHYSLQAKTEMTLADLNTKINDFLGNSGRRLTKEQWLKEYPSATETS